MLTEEMTKMTKRKTSEAKSSRLESRQRLVMIEEIGIQTEEMKKSSQSNRSKKTEKPVEK